MPSPTGRWAIGPSGPMPERRRIAGEWIAPAQSTTPRARTSMHVPADAGPNAGGAAPLRRAPCPQVAAAEDPQVCALACRLQVRVVGRDPGTVARVEAERRHAGRGGSVVVLAPAVSEPEGRLGERVVGRPPRRRGAAAATGIGPSITVVGLVAEVGVALHPPQVGQHVGVRPPGAAVAPPSGRSRPAWHGGPSCR